MKKIILSLFLMLISAHKAHTMDVSLFNRVTFYFNTNDQRAEFLQNMNIPLALNNQTLVNRTRAGQTLRCIQWHVDNLTSQQIDQTLATFGNQNLELALTVVGLEYSLE